MRVFGHIILAAVLTLAATQAAAQDKAKSWQLLTGQGYLELAEYDREVYVTGVNDAYNWSFASGFTAIKWLAPCMYARKAPQLAAIYAKWLKENPERWHEPAAKLFLFAMSDSCRKTKPKTKPKPAKAKK